MASKKIKIDKDLYDRCLNHAEKEGYSSIEEFIQHVLEKEVSQKEEESDSKKVEEKLKGLGYIS